MVYISGWCQLSCLLGCHIYDLSHLLPPDQSINLWSHHNKWNINTNNWANSLHLKGPWNVIERYKKAVKCTLIILSKNYSHDQECFFVLFCFLAHTPKTVSVLLSLVTCISDDFQLSWLKVIFHHKILFCLSVALSLNVSNSSTVNGWFLKCALPSAGSLWRFTLESI